jgi:hypothetical protein
MSLGVVKPRKIEPVDDDEPSPAPTPAPTPAHVPQATPPATPDPATEDPNAPAFSPTARALAVFTAASLAFAAWACGPYDRIEVPAAVAGAALLALCGVFAVWLIAADRAAQRA